MTKAGRAGPSGRTNALFERPLTLTRPQRPRWPRLAGFVLTGLILSSPAPAHAQSTTDAPPAGTQGAGPQGGHHGRGRRANRPASAQPIDAPKPVRDPWPRLDPGAVLCRTEAALQQHQEAIGARLDGREASEPAGCRLVSRMTAVAIMDRHGPARTQVRLPGPPEEIGWTDVVMRNEPPRPP